MPEEVKTIKIHKVGGDSTPPPPKVAKKKQTAKKSMRTFPRGILKKGGKTGRSAVKIEGVRDPAKPPPVRKSTLRILTDKGVEKKRQTIRKTVRNMSSHKVRETLAKSGIKVHPKTPDHLAKEILEGGVEAGFISSG
jgi:hypothetical protein